MSTLSKLAFGFTGLIATTMVFWGLAANLDAELALQALDRQEAFVSYRAAHHTNLGE